MYSVQDSLIFRILRRGSTTIASSPVSCQERFDPMPAARSVALTAALSDFPQFLEPNAAIVAAVKCVVAAPFCSFSTALLTVHSAVRLSTNK
jgi:hypothetical protein